MKVRMADLRSKDKPELEKMFRESSVELRQLRVKAGGQDLKNVRAIRHLRKILARLATRLQELKSVKIN